MNEVMYLSDPEARSGPNYEHSIFFLKLSQALPKLYKAPSHLESGPLKLSQAPKKLNQAPPKMES